VLAMSTMRFADEVVPRSTVEGLTKRATKPDIKALHMAKDLIDGLSAEWDPARYRDTYTEELRARIKAKNAGKTIAEPVEASDAKVVDLMAALQASVEAAKGKRKPARRRSSPAPRARKSAERAYPVATGSMLDRK
jgi:DNA end-binding protein Ku